jgi:hypothetical protein
LFLPRFERCALTSIPVFTVLDDGHAANEGANALTEAIASIDQSRNGLLKVAAGGVLSGALTPLLPPLIDKINGSPGDFRIALVAIPSQSSFSFWFGDAAQIRGGRRWRQQSSP